jgi:hypothetical protein
MTAASAQRITGAHPILNAISRMTFQVSSAIPVIENEWVEGVSSSCLDIIEVEKNVVGHGTNLSRDEVYTTSMVEYKRLLASGIF